MPEPKRPLKVFLCHASTDKPKVRELYKYLKKRGIQPWLDEEDLVGGQDWEAEISKALATSDAIIICITKNSINKEGYVQKEIKFALDKALEMPEGRIFLIPVRYEDCDVPLSLSRYQWINLYLRGGYEKLIRTLKNRADQIGVLPPYLEEIIPHKPWRKIFLAFIIGVLIIGTVLASILRKGAPIIEYYLNVPTPTTTVTITITPYVTALLPTNTFTEEPAVEAAQNLIPTEITDAKGVSMMFVPEGGFNMGNNDGEDNEKPVHEIYLETFYIDKYEVTNSQYKLCVDAGGCTPPSTEVYFGQVRYANHPVTFVSWYMANAYCSWREARLPTEAEWEKAGRGGSDTTYPWGDTVDCSYANYRGINGHCVGDSAPVGSYSAGVSIYGVYDLIGNAMEWVGSVYADYPYDANDGREGLNVGNVRVIRGGSWNNRESDIHVTTRAWGTPSKAEFDLGFRCAKGVIP